MIVEFKNIDIYNGDNIFLKNFNLNVERGKLYPLVYSRGKEEFKYIFRYLSNLRGEYSGRIEFDNSENKSLLEKIIFLPAKGGYYPEMTAFEQFEFFSKMYSNFSLDKAREIAYEFKIPLELKLKKLADFQRRLILISAILATKVSILFLEEPYTHLPGGEASLLQYIFAKELKSERSILFTISDNNITRYNFEKYYLLKDDGLELKKLKKEEKDEVKKKKIKKIPVWDNEKAFLVDYNEIRWISTHKGKSTLHTEEKEYNVNLLLRELEERLDFPPFFRCHRSYIINLNYIEEVITWFNGTYNLKVGDEEIPVSRSNVEVLEKMLGI